MSGHQQTIYTIHESQLNNGGQRNNSDLLIDTSSIPLQQQAMPPMQHHQHQLQPTSSSSSAALFNAAGEQQQQQQLQQSAGNSSMAVTNQPSGSGGGGGSSRVAPENQAMVYSVHPVFQQLEQHSALLIRQQADCTSTCCGFESVNTYTVRSKDGVALLKAIENSNCLERCCFEGNREYNLTLVSGEDEVVARIRKPYRVSRFCCYSNAARIESPEDNPIGHIRQLFTLFGHPKFAIYDSHQPPKVASFLIESTTCRFCCTPCLCTCVCGNKRFKIISADTRKEVGSIARRWSNDCELDEEELEQQQQTNADHEQPFNSSSAGGQQVFGVKFAPHLEARHKVLLLSACFMMDFFYFENDRRRRKLASC